MEQINVLIVGAGPTGLTLAINLIRNGINCKVIDKRLDQKSSASKAITVNAATLKLYQNLGIVDEFIKHGCTVNDIYVHWYSRKLMHINYRYLDSPYKYFLSIPQPKSESILLQYFLDLGGEVSFSTELIGINNANSNHVEVTLLNDGIMYNQKAQYLIGCDGARSSIREFLDINFIGRDYGIFFELIDVEIDWNGDKAATHYYVVEDCFVIIIPMTENKHRIVIKNNIDNFDQMQVEKSADYYENIISQCGVLNLKIKNILWRSFSKFYNRLIESYNYGDKIFFAGDACHLFSPIGGLGMNTGVQDAFNLSWRLAGVISNTYNPIILADYNKERRFIGDRLVKSTDASTELIMRLNKQDNILTNWLPTMKNRKNIKQDFPLNFSGLAHNYQFNNKGIYHVPWANGVDMHSNKNISSYDMVDGINFSIVLLVKRMETKLNSIIQQLLRYSNVKIWCITDTINAAEHIDGVNLIFDKYGEFYKSFTNTVMSDIVIVRPDGYIEFACKLDNVGKLQSYLEYYFLQVNSLFDNHYCENIVNYE